MSRKSRLSQEILRNKQNQSQVKENPAQFNSFLKGIQNNRPKSREAIKNGLGSAMGMGGEAIGFQDWGYTFTTYGTELSQVNTLFKNNRWYLISNMRQLLNELYVEHGLIQTIVDVPVDDALRGGIEISSKQLSEEQIQEIQISIDRDDDLRVVGDAAKWNRLFGGAGILIMTDQDPTTPFDLRSINRDTPLEFRAADLWELFWDKQNTEGYDPEIQFNNFEFYNYYARMIHKSRVMRLTGITAPSFVRPRLRGWGFSVIEQLVRSVNQYLKATDLAFELLDEFKIDVYKIKNLVDTLVSPDGQSQVAKRIQMANWQKNYQHAITMDGEDDYIQKQLSFAGWAEVMKEIRMQVAADMRMPITKLFGQSYSGLAGGNEDDIEVYNSMVEGQVRNKIKYDCLRIVEIKSQKLFGFIPTDIDIKFKPLRVLSAEQEENVKTQKFTRLIQARSSGEITTFEFREACNKDNLLGVQLDTADEQLNMDDPEIEQVVLKKPNLDNLQMIDGVPSEPDAARSTGNPNVYYTAGPSTDDPGANREDSRSPRAWDATTVQPKVPHQPLPVQRTEARPPKKAPPRNMPKKMAADGGATRNDRSWWEFWKRKRQENPKNREPLNIPKQMEISDESIRKYTKPR